MLTQRQIFLQHIAQTSPSPMMLEIERAEGVYMYSPDGKTYMDLISGIGVSNVGHCHPEVVDAVKNQVEKYMHLMVYGEIVQTPQVKLAEKLSAILPDQLNNVYLVNSGSEAIEGAIKLAKRYSGKPEIISCYNAYHGSTNGALSIIGNPDMSRAFRPLLPGIKRIQFNKYEDLENITENTAAVIIEPIQGEGGVRIPDIKYMQELRKVCTEKGALLVMDEIQTGFGRTGKFWGFEHFGIVPDVLVCAKGMGGGMPIGAFIASKEVMNVLTFDPVLGHITTFGGHPVSAAASLATADILCKGNYIQEANKKGKFFYDNLRNSIIKEIRQIGLFIAVEFESYNIMKKVIDTNLENGVLTDWFLFCENAMRIAPPLTITEQEVERACEIINSTFNKVNIK